MIFRPQLEIAGSVTRLLVDQMRSVDVDYVHGDPVHYLDRSEMAEVEHAVVRYLGL
ncbi:mRNA-degrading endonuclease toxin of MazEF toxin-antitoxin module [Lipingzhangella halophila]|uniref:mRNA-degrading endonuclease toxin of MazEF toxin-antitoxin module n=2 Tax=Lipingzhangella halophila TaxID=1783352 RepID=A0A7W7W5S7_9ACTN|nr:mRNA-degrading endonuclease toxin of MazEF toxin-antitoxin module [Lipingzhangella halophila]